MKFSTFLFLFFAFFQFGFSQSFKKEIKKHRKEYKADFLEIERSPFYNNKADLKYLRFFKPRKKYQVECTFKLTPDAKPFDMATYSGQVQPYRKYGDLEFMIDGKKLTLEVYENLRYLKIPGYEDYLFLPFKDLTNDRKTYGGGRYINLSKKDAADGKVTLDFNKNYNPWCAFSDGYNCPIPPKANHLDVSIKAGEKNYAKQKD